MTDARLGFERGDELEVEALLTDHYLASLLAARDRRARDVPADLRLDPEMRSVAQRLDAELGRVHPSFHFEERLATRLADLAAAMQRAPSAEVDPAAVGPRLLVLTDATEEDAADAAQPADSASDRAPAHGAHAAAPGAILGRGQCRAAGHRPPQSGGQRPLLIGGAITSAAISLAGAYVAWRRGRPPAGPMARAVRAVHPSRAGQGIALPIRGHRSAATRGGLR